MRIAFLILSFIPILSFSQKRDIQEHKYSVKDNSLFVGRSDQRIYTPKGIDSLSFEDFGGNPIVDYLLSFYDSTSSKRFVVAHDYEGDDSTSYSKSFTQSFEHDIAYSQISEGSFYSTKEGIDVDRGREESILKFPPMSTETAKTLVSSLVQMHSYDYPQGNFPDGMDGWKREQKEGNQTQWVYQDPNLDDKMFDIVIIIEQTKSYTSISRIYRWSFGC